MKETDIAGTAGGSMIILIAGATHTGKTNLAQKLLEAYGYPYLSLDHLKMGLIRSGQTELTPLDDEKLTDYLWKITKEIVKTAIENRQNLIVEGCYIPYHWQRDFDERYLREIQYIALVMSEAYIRTNFDSIRGYANVIEKRMDDSGCTQDFILSENERVLKQCRQHCVNFYLIDGKYPEPSEIMRFLSGNGAVTP